MLKCLFPKISTHRTEVESMMVIIKTFTTPGGKYVYDRETNSLLSVSDEEYVACKRVEMDIADDNDWHLLKRYTDQGYLQESCLKEIEHPATPYMSMYLENHVAYMTLQIVQSCNLRCSYCFYGGNYIQRSHSHKTMSLETIKSSIDFAMKHSRSVNELVLGFYGGEPLLAIDNIKKCVEYINNAYAGKQVRYTITTNGTLINSQIVQFLEKHNFDVFISLDGPKELHNANRVFADGKGSFDKIMSNVSFIRDNFPVYYKKVGFITTVAPNIELSCINNFYAAETVLAENNAMVNTINFFSTNESVIYDDMYYCTYNYETMKLLLSHIGMYSHSKTSKIYERFILDLEKFWKLLSGSTLTNKSHPGGPCLPGVSRPFIAVDGTIYPCERVSESTEAMKIGHVNTGFDLKKILAILNVGKLTESACKICWNFHGCGLCAAACDKDGTLSRDERLKNCRIAKQITIEKLLCICLLTENGYDFMTRTTIRKVGFK